MEIIFIFGVVFLTVLFVLGFILKYGSDRDGDLEDRLVYLIGNRMLALAFTIMSAYGFICVDDITTMEILIYFLYAIIAFKFIMYDINNTHIIKRQILEETTESEENK